MNEATLAEAAETITPPDGFDWVVVNYRRYSQASKDGSPTLYIEHGHDGDTQMVYLMGQHHLAPEVITNGQS